jgi:hypothetical protein
MAKRSIHLSICRCLKCNGPVVTAWFGVRVEEIQREINVGSCPALCLSVITCLMNGPTRTEYDHSRPSNGTDSCASAYLPRMSFAGR